MGVMAIAAGCAKEQESIAPTPVAVEEPASSAVPGMIRLKVNADLAEKLIAASDEDGNVSAEAAAALRIDGVAVKSVSTTFHIGGPYLKEQKNQDCIAGSMWNMTRRNLFRKLPLISRK